MPRIKALVFLLALATQVPLPSAVEACSRDSRFC
jgi:hypothetical protein